MPQLSYAQDIHGVMLVVKGDIKVISGKDSKTEAAKVGKKVFSGDTIVSGPDARAKIVMSDKNVLNISPDSKLVIEKYTNNGDSKNVELKVEYGKIRASVEQKYDGEKSKFNVKTPSAVAGVRGTDFLTGYNRANKQSQVITFSGTVAVGQPGPGGSIANPVFVQPGQMTTAAEGQAPEAPKAVPKEELNKASQETVADGNSANSSTQASETAENREEKKEEPQEKKDERKEAKEEKGEVKEDRKNAKEEAADKKISDDKTKNADNDGGKKPGDKATNDRKPADEGSTSASGRGPSMVDSRDLGPELSRDINVNGGSGPVGPAPIRNFQPGSGTFVTQPPPSQFINNAIQNQKSRTTIIINK